MFDKMFKTNSGYILYIVHFKEKGEKVREKE